MKLWKISQTLNDGYDIYDSAIVAADTEELAKEIDPGGSFFWKETAWYYKTAPDQKASTIFQAWTTPQHVTAVLIGEALPDQVTGVILASFNAG